MTKDDMVANIVKMDKQGRICLGAFLRDDVKVLALEYAIDPNLVFIFAPNFKEDSFFCYPTVTVDSKKRIIIPSWMRTYLDTEMFGIAFSEDRLTLVPIYG